MQFLYGNVRWDRNEREGASHITILDEQRVCFRIRYNIFEHVMMFSGIVVLVSLEVESTSGIERVVVSIAIGEIMDVYQILEILCSLCGLVIPCAVQ